MTIWHRYVENVARKKFPHTQRRQRSNFSLTSIQRKMTAVVRGRGGWCEGAWQEMMKRKKTERTVIKQFLFSSPSPSYSATHFSNITQANAFGRLLRKLFSEGGKMKRFLSGP
jgi:hypothetical protein